MQLATGTGTRPRCLEVLPVARKARHTREAPQTGDHRPVRRCWWNGATRRNQAIDQTHSCARLLATCPDSVPDVSSLEASRIKFPNSP